MNLYLKACPRCQGDVKTNRDIYGDYKECLQCGYMIDIPKPSLISIPQAQAKTKTRVKARAKTRRKAA